MRAQNRLGSRFNHSSNRFNRRAPFGTSDQRYSVAGTRWRWSAGSATVGSTSVFTLQRLQIGTPAYVTRAPRFFIQTWISPTAGETATAGVLTIRGISARINGVWVNANPSLFPITVDPATSPNGMLLPALTDLVFPADSLVELRFSLYAPAGSVLPRGLTTWAGFDATQGSTTNLDAKLTDGSTVSSGTGFSFAPAVMFALGGDGRPAFMAIGDSIGNGGTAATSVWTARGAQGYLDVGFDDNTLGKRLALWNSCVSGNSQIQWNTVSNIPRKWQAWQDIMTELGQRPFDMLVFQHITNSKTGTLPEIFTATRGVIAKMRAIFGQDLPVLGVEGLAGPESTDGFQTLANQTTIPSITHPTGQLWQYNVAVGGANGLGDPAATLRADGTMQDSIAPWRKGSFDTGANRDKVKVLSFVGGATSATTPTDLASGATTFTLSQVPQIGDNLFVYNSTTGAQIKLGVVTAVSGNNVTVVWTGLNSNAIPAATSVFTIAMHDGGLHPGVAAGRIYAEAITDWKQARGLA